MAMVAGCSLVPEPPARMIPFRVEPMQLTSGLLSAQHAVSVDPTSIVAAGDFVYPCSILEVPANGVFNACSEAMRRPPAKIPLQLGKIHRITSIMSSGLEQK